MVSPLHKDHPHDRETRPYTTSGSLIQAVVDTGLTVKSNTCLNTTCVVYFKHHQCCLPVFKHHLCCLPEFKHHLCCVPVFKYHLHLNVTCWIDFSHVFCISQVKIFWRTEGYPNISDHGLKVHGKMLLNMIWYCLHILKTLVNISGEILYNGIFPLHYFTNISSKFQSACNNQKHILFRALIFFKE